MKVHCVCVVRDEADIVGFALDSALAWAHTIYVLDNGSSDGTWELLNRYSERNPQVIVVGRDGSVFRDAMRGEVVNQIDHDAQEGDWWCRLDADELYVGDPRDVLRRTPDEFGLVYKASIEYFFTDRDLAEYEEDPDRYVREWTPDRIRYYAAWWSEIRFVRHFPGVTWDGAWPQGVKNLKGSPDRVLVRHFQYRNPPQIERRLLTRIARTEDRAFRHEKVSVWNPLGREQDLVYPRVLEPGEPLWKTRIYRAEALNYDAGDGNYIVDWDALPPVQPGRTRLQRVVFYFKGMLRS
jgi:glycosyltransferase involved in cell wall biosynthesis